MVCIANASSRNEVWPEIDLFHQINDTYRMHLLSAFVNGRDSTYSDGQVGVHLDIGMLPIIRKRLLPDANLYRYL